MSSGIAIHIGDNYKKVIVLLSQGWYRSPHVQRFCALFARIILVDSRVHMVPHMLILVLVFATLKDLISPLLSTSILM